MAKLTVLCVCLAFFVTDAAAANSESPYAGQQGREIKALSPEDVQGYLSGQGMGLAKAAELNGYPGPAHVLALASELQLTPEQRRQTEQLFTDMQARTRTLGRTLIEEEHELDQQFASKTISDESLATLTKNIGELQARIRQAHLEAHLAQLAILTPSQSMKYNELRGYTSGTQHVGHEQMH